MAYSPPLDGAAGLVLFFFFIYGIVAFIVATVAENIVLWRLGWGSFLDSLVVSFIMNLVSTIAGVFAASAYNTGLDQDTIQVSGGSILPILFILLFIITLILEGVIMLGIGRSRHDVEAILRMVISANVISYILLGIGFIYVW